MQGMILSSRCPTVANRGEGGRFGAGGLKHKSASVQLLNLGEICRAAGGISLLSIHIDGVFGDLIHQLNVAKQAFFSEHVFFVLIRRLNHYLKWGCGPKYEDSAQAGGSTISMCRQIDSLENCY